MIINDIERRVQDSFCSYGREYFSWLVKRKKIKIRKDGSLKISIKKIFELYGSFKKKFDTGWNHGNDIASIANLLGIPNFYYELLRLEIEETNKEAVQKYFRKKIKEKNESEIFTK